MLNKLLFLINFFPITIIFCDLIKLSDIIIREHTPIGQLLVKLKLLIRCDCIMIKKYKRFGLVGQGSAISAISASQIIITSP